MVRRPLVIALNAVLAAAAALVLVGSFGAGRDEPVSAAATVTTAHQSATTVTHSSTTVTRTTRPAPTTTRPAATTAPPTTRPSVPVPTTRRAPVLYPPRTTYRYPTYTYATRPVPTTPTTSTTIAPIGGRLPVPPSTLPLATKVQSSHVSPVFAALSGAGLFVALCIMAGRWILTRSGRDAGG